MTYPGGKNGSGVYQAIINQIPPHRVYVEPFLGSGAIMRMKKPALASIGVDADAAVIASFDGASIPGLKLICDDALVWLDQEFTADTFIYLDPPYLMETRSSHRNYYRYELTDDDHLRLLKLITAWNLKCKIAISGYYSDLYVNSLAGWRKISFQTTTRGGGKATEYLWMNYPEPLELHDYRYLGSNFRERERIKRKKTRWAARLQRMPSLERMALLATIEELRTCSTTDNSDIYR